MLSPVEARRIKAKLLNAPVAPGTLSRYINVRTDAILDALERQYFAQDLADGISTFKYLEGQYGTGKTQLIECLASRARRNRIVTSVVKIGVECPFSSPHAIFRNVMGSFQPGDEDGDHHAAERGITVVFQSWIETRLREMGVSLGSEIPVAVRHQLERPFTEVWNGAPDEQMAQGLQALGLALVSHYAGAGTRPVDSELKSWVKGDGVRSKNLQAFGIFEPTRDETAFQRLRTVISFLRERMSFRGFLIAFDEGTRVMSFRRGSVKQRQAIENMLTMINHNAEGEFGGVMFLYAATPDLRTEVIQNYIALRDRIGNVAFTPGMPMTPFINLDDQNFDETAFALGNKLLDVFAIAEGIQWDAGLQRANLEALLRAQKQQLAFSDVPPRFFVFHWCRFLESQKAREVKLDVDAAMRFVQENRLPEPDEGSDEPSKA